VGEGYALLRLGKATDALAAFETALGPEKTVHEHDPDDAEALLGRALALEALHREAEAISSLREFLRRAPNHVAAGDARARLARLSSRAAP